MIQILNLLWQRNQLGNLLSKWCFAAQLPEGLSLKLTLKPTQKPLTRTQLKFRYNTIKIELMRNNSLQVPLHYIALKTHTKTLATFFIVNQDILKNPLIFDTRKMAELANAFQPFIKTIADIWKENEMLISGMQSNIAESRPLYPQRDHRYQRTDLQIKLKRNRS
jgi:hypothetical protein